VLVTPFSSPPPNFWELEALLTEAVDIPLKAAVVESGIVNFFGLVNIKVPTAVSS